MYLFIQLIVAGPKVTDIACFTILRMGVLGYHTHVLSPYSVVFVLTSAGLQKWFIGDTHEQLVYDAALEEMIKDAVGQNNWVSGHTTAHGYRSLFSVPLTHARTHARTHTHTHTHARTHTHTHTHTPQE